ncbi:hypothetical protein Vi05172_g11150 [Venturia inaequalis]|nr:hypothetical protein Vi05172_g11150 [Venturia inaequalis]
MSIYLRWAELPARKDVYTYAGTTRWGNHDLYPIPRKERTYGQVDYFVYWMVSCLSVSNFSSASAYIALGLTAGETIGAVFLGACFSAATAVFAARPGQDHAMGYTVMNRATYGMWGTLIPYTVVLLGGIVFSGMQAYSGGLAVTLLIGAVIPSFHNLQNTLPESSATTTKNIIGFFIYIAIYLPIAYFTPPHKLQKFLYLSIFMTAVCFAGLLGWIIHANGGHVNMLSSNITLTASDRAFRIVQCASTISGSWSGAAERFSDWTRFAKKKNSPYIGMTVGLALAVVLSAVIGAVVTSAATEVYPDLVNWNPITLLLNVQDAFYTPKCRVATFFAGVALLTSQIYNNYAQNTVPWGMDMVGLLPKYLSIRRGCILIILLTIIVQPWRFFSQAEIFVQILSVLTLFVGASTYVLCVDYWIIRRRQWKIPDLFMGKGSIYWYTGGWNFRVVIALVMGMWPSMPGLVWDITGTHEGSAWVRVFQINYFVGMPISVVTFLLLCWTFPPLGCGIQENLDEQVGMVIEGLEVVGGKGPSGGVEELKGEKSV